MDSTETVTDQEAGQRFVISADGAEAELRYRSSEGRLALIHTEVPAAFRGQGVGGRLVQAAVERARRTGETVVPACPYARRWLEEHPDATAGVDIDWSQPR